MIHSTDLHADGNRLCRFANGGTEVVETFSSHWAAVAAMIRMHDPSFVSMGGDRPEDLEKERALGARVFTR